MPFRGIRDCVVRTYRIEVRVNHSNVVSSTSLTFWIGGHGESPWQGWRGFYRGLLPSLLKTVPASAITFLVYDKAREGIQLLRS